MAIQRSTERGITHLLARAYAAPADPAYWRGLESRIMRRIAEADLGWWTEFDRWRRPALVAAALLVVGAGITMYRAREASRVLIYADLVAPVDDAAGAPDALLNPRDVALRELMRARD